MSNTKTIPKLCEISNLSYTSNNLE